jgi:predicted ester cyclase
MTADELARQYRAYIDCLNRRDWGDLSRFVGNDVTHNGRQLGVAGYRQMLEQDVSDIPDLVFSIECVAVDPPLVASRLAFDCRPSGAFLGLPVHGRRVRFAENVFYTFNAGRISDVRSVIDKASIEAQLRQDAASGETDA